MTAYGQHTPRVLRALRIRVWHRWRCAPAPAAIATDHVSRVPVLAVAPMAAPAFVRASTNVMVRPNIVARKSVATDGDRGTAGAQEGAHATVDRELRGAAVCGARLRERRRERRGTRGRRSRADRIQLLPDQGPTGHRSGRAGSGEVRGADSLSASRRYSCGRNSRLRPRDARHDS